MTARKVRGAAAVAWCAVACLVGGCGGGGGDSAANLAGRWTGALSIGYAGAGGLSGGIALDLFQVGDFASGSATWAAYGGTQSIAGPIDGDSFELRLHFRCAVQAETAVLLGTVAGETLTITGATGNACSPRGAALSVASAAGLLTRTRDGLPL